MGRPGRNKVKSELPNLVHRYAPKFVIVNGENAASGVGITPEIAQELFNWGVDAITLGNHAFDKKEIMPYLDVEPRIVRPANMPAAVPGRGWTIVESDGIQLAVVNLCGRVFMGSYDDPFREVDRILDSLDTPHVLIDFHAEATSEKIAFAWHVDGRATAVLGTHTHVPTADERVLPGGTATISDVGMCGPIDSVLGMDRNVILRRFTTGLPGKFEVPDNPGVISGVVIDVEVNTGRAIAIERVRVGAGH